MQSGQGVNKSSGGIGTGGPTPEVLGDVPITRKYTDLANREPEKRLTDYDTWAQAEAALQKGLSVETLVRREFGRTYTFAHLEAVVPVKNTKEISGLVADYEKYAPPLSLLVNELP